MEENLPEMNLFYNGERRQYDANKILEYLHENHLNERFRIIGLFRVDLYIPILTYIFGQAYFKGRAGVASIYRLRNEQYGMPKDDDLLLQRFIKVIIHELGHTFGLVHCHNPGCVMRTSTYVEDIDQKSTYLCNHCKPQLKL